MTNLVWLKFRQLCFKVLYWLTVVAVFAVPVPLALYAIYSTDVRFLVLAFASWYALSVVAVPAARKLLIKELKRQVECIDADMETIKQALIQSALEYDNVDEFFEMVFAKYPDLANDELNEDIRKAVAEIKEQDNGCKEKKDNGCK